jgi:hypothetical protein
MVHDLTIVLDWQADRTLPCARAVLAALAADRLTVALRCELASSALPADELVEVLADLARTNSLHAGALARTVDIIGGQEQDRSYLLDDFFPRRVARTSGWQTRRRVGAFAFYRAIGPRERFGLEDAERLEALLGASGDARLRRVGLAALSAWAAAAGWDEAKKGRLDRYRADHSPMVAEPAQFMFPPRDNGQGPDVT